MEGKKEICCECKTLKVNCAGLCWYCYIKEYPESLAAQSEKEYQAKQPFKPTT